MAETVLAAVKVAPGQMEIREFPMPEIPDDGALVKVEVAGICGSDVKMYGKPLPGNFVIMGHENVGVIAKAGRKFVERKGVKEGDRVFLEHYLPCMQCEWCHLGEYRHCEATDWHHNPAAIRYGYTSAESAPYLWGGFGQYLYLPWNAVVHKVPEGVTAELAGIGTPLANGIQWSLFDANIGYGAKVLIQGPGQQGLSQVVAAKQAGADLIIITGTTKDARRLEVAKALGADYAIDVQKEDPLERIMEITSRKGMDFSIDCTARAGTAALMLGVEALKRKGGTLVVQGNEMPTIPDFPIERITLKYVTIKSARGHSYRAVELALQQLASHRFPLELVTTHTFGLNDVDYAIKSVGGQGAKDVIHVSVLPWKEGVGGPGTPSV
ncbi:MAG: D-arabitol-phosphate dehydrogenase [Candidatus Eremiobacteraeota bacterium]|nr:D-arabitol-phosphate dehydrogenase [Candidatus Eremiobacteraeota bacterium]